jgi:hypothetical protein
MATAANAKHKLATQHAAQEAGLAWSLKKTSTFETLV